MMNAYERGRAAWPTIVLDRRCFAERLAAIDGVHYVEDLYLAMACAASMPAALLQLERAYLADVPRFIARIDGSPLVAAEVQQVVREHVLVARPGKPPRIGEYSGRGSLRAWLRVIAIRQLHALRRRLRHEVPAEPARFLGLAAAAPDAERALADARERHEFERAFLAALWGLNDCDRRLLRLHIVEGYTIDDLALATGMHRGTVARRLVRIKRRLCDDTLSMVEARLGIDRLQARDALAAVRSLMDVSLRPLLSRPSGDR
jgi:RNA polymerase sigma-70 factor (ECF subfamily)